MGIPFTKWDPSDWSPLERRLWTILKDLKYLGFKHNYKLETEGRTFYGDFQDPLLKLCFEADGRRYHKDKVHEAERDGYFKRAGYKIFHFTGSQIVNNPEWVKSEIRKIVKERMNELSNE